jgi:hypothetical protein
VALTNEVRKTLMKPNTSTDMKEKNGRSNSTSTERRVIKASCSRMAHTRLGDTAVASRDLEEDVF